MKNHLFVVGLVAVVPLVACGAAPEESPGEGTAAEPVGTSVEAQSLPTNLPRSVSFDADQNGAFLKDGQSVVSAYSSKVTFSCDGCSSASDVYARYPGRAGLGVSIKQLVQTNYTEPGFSASMGVAQASFARAASCVTVDAYATAPGNASPFHAIVGAPWLEARDASGNVLGSAAHSGTLGQWETLAVCTSSYAIASVRFSSSDAKSGQNGVIGRFDNFVFDAAPIVKPPPILQQPPNTTQPPILP